MPLKGRAPIPGPLKPAISMKDFSGFGSTYSSHSSLRDKKLNIETADSYIF